MPLEEFILALYSSIAEAGLAGMQLKNLRDF
jgi:hypothetical protein